MNLLHFLATDSYVTECVAVSKSTSELELVNVSARIRVV